MTEKIDTIMDERLSQLKEAKQRFDLNNQISIPKIQRVSNFLRQNERFYKYCTPKIISFGPIHHNTKSLKEGEHYKLLWTSKFVEEYKKIDQDDDEASKLLLKKIKDNIEDLKNMFTEDAIEGYHNNDLAWILFVDGCSLIHFMEKIDHQCPQTLNLKYDQLMHMVRDAMLLENQLPSKMLEIICKEKGVDLRDCYTNFLTMGEWKRQGRVVIRLFKHSLPFHILDSRRSLYLTSYMDIIEENEHNIIEGNEHIEENEHNIIEGNEHNIIEENEDNIIEGNEHNIIEENEHNIIEENEHNQVRKNTILNQDDCNEELNFNWNTYKNIRDLKNAGIRVMANEKLDKCTWSNISFKSKWLSGELRLPVFLFNNGTLYLFRNLIAYEMCPDVPYNYECCSFFAFMDSLVDNAEDVKELRLAGVFQNLLGSDEELANHFNDLGDHLPIKMCCHFSYTNAVACSKKYIRIKQEIEKHCTTKWKTWLAQAYNTHFNTPWAMIAFLAASLALILTFIQTWYAIHPK